MGRDRVLPRYMGSGALEYEALRVGDPKWASENRALATLISQVGLEQGSLVLDLPCGTGRELPLLADAGVRVIAADASPDMLSLVRLDNAQLLETEQLFLMQANISHIALPDHHVDLSVCLRLSNWLPPHQLERGLGELVRVSRNGVILGIRYWTRRDIVLSTTQPLTVWRFAALKWGRQTRTTGRVVLSGSHVSGIFSRLGIEVRDHVLIDQRIDGTTYRIAHLVPKGSPARSRTA